MASEPPNDPEAERKLVGAAILMPSLCDMEVTDLDFFTYGAMWGAIQDLVVRSEPVSASTVALKAKVDRADVVACMSGADPDEAPFWAARIIQLRKKRALQAAGDAALRMALTDSDSDADYARIESMLTAGASGRDEGTTDMDAGATLMMERIDRYIADPDALAGVPTGWHKLDRILDGLRPGGVTIVYAKTSSYKSMFVGNIGWRLASRGVAGMWFTTESPAHEVMERLAQFEAGLNFRELRYHRELHAHQEEIRDAANAIREYPIWVCDRSTLDVDFVAGVVSRMNRQRKLDYIIIDLVDHVTSKFLGRSETESEKYIARRIKEIAKRESLHIVLTTHVKKPDRFLMAAKKPYIDIGEARGSGSKIGDADAAISLMLVKRADFGGYEPMEYEEIIAQRDAEKRHLLYASVQKNRHGDLANVLFNVDLLQGARMMPEI